MECSKPAITCLRAKYLPFRNEGDSMHFDELWRFIADHAALQALFGLLLSWTWSADSAKDWARGKAWMSVSWFVVGLAILLTFVVAFVREKEWLALAIALAGLLIQAWRLHTIISREPGRPHPE